MKNSLSQRDIISMFVEVEVELNIVEQQKLDISIQLERDKASSDDFHQTLDQYTALHEEFLEIRGQRSTIIDLAIRHGYNAGDLLRAAVAKIQEHDYQPANKEEWELIKAEEAIARLASM